VPGAVAVVLALLLPLLAAAQEPATRAFRYSAYEEATLDAALGRLGLERDLAPEGKLVEAVHTVRLEVVEERDPAPRLVNALHVVTRAYVAEREALLRPGDAYRQTLADETRRKLAALPQLSLALVVAARGGAADRTQVVIVTKDVWSIRLNWDLSLTSSGLDALSVNPSETNLLGTHQTLGLRFDLRPESYSVGANYGVPRVRGSHVAAGASGGAIVNRRTGSREGSFGAAQVTSPLWSSRTAWAWSVGGSWLDEVTRLYSDGRRVAFALDARTDCAAAPALCLPWEYESEVAEASAAVTRSFGWAVKHDLSAGFEARTSRFALPSPQAFDPATVAEFVRTRLPVGEDRVGPFFQYRTYTTSFLRVLDLETLALQEDYRLGPQASITLYPVLRALGSSRDLVGVAAGAAFTAAIRDGLARAALDSTTELSRGGDVDDGSLQASVRLASPRSRAGRVVVDAVVVDRWANRLNRLSSLGGDARLRGYPTRFLVGSRAAVANLELRSRPWQLLRSLQLGGAAFWDAGDAFDRWAAFRPRHSVGLGLRALFPQLDRVVFRVDVGFPLDRAAGVDAANFVATFGQAFSP
jgi:hypothetical protein